MYDGFTGVLDWLRELGVLELAAGDKGRTPALPEGELEGAEVELPNTELRVLDLMKPELDRIDEILEGASTLDCRGFRTINREQNITKNSHCDSLIV